MHAQVSSFQVSSLGSFLAQDPNPGIGTGHIHSERHTFLRINTPIDTLRSVSMAILNLA